MHRAITHCLAWRITLALILVATLAGGVPALARHGVRLETTDRFEFRSVAEQELALEDDALVWQASELPTFLDEEHPIPFFAGFLYAHDAPLIVYRDGGRRFARLTADDALAVEDGELLAPVALRDDDATFLALELVAEDDAFDPVGDPFMPEAGDYVLDLLRAESEGAQEDEDEPVSLDEAKWPVLLVVVEGKVELLVADDEPEELKAGDVLTVDADFDLRWIGDEAGVVLAAVLRLPEADEDDRDDEADEQEDGADDPRPTTTPGADADQGGGSGSGSGDGASQPAPTPTPKPTEAPEENSGGTLPPPGPPPTDDPPDSGGPGGSGSGSGSGGVGVELGPGDGPCNFCAPAEDGLIEEDVSSDPCLLADGGGDPDGDELNNCGEAAAGTYPNVQDSDGDGAWDGFEVRTGTNPRSKDTDGDGLDDWDEFTYSTNPLTPDTDGDGLSDTQELFTYGTRPEDVDSDHDCLWDGEEIYTHGTSPLNLDTDGDGFPDSIEIAQGYNPLDGGHHPDEELVAGTGC